MDVKRNHHYATLATSRNRLKAKERHEGLTFQEQTELEDIDDSMDAIDDAVLAELDLVGARLASAENPMETVGAAL